MFSLSVSDLDRFHWIFFFFGWEMNDNLQPAPHIDRHIQASYDYSMNLSHTLVYANLEENEFRQRQTKNR